MSLGLKGLRGFCGDVTSHENQELSVIFGCWGRGGGTIYRETIHGGHMEYQGEDYAWGGGDIYSRD